MQPSTLFQSHVQHSDKFYWWRRILEEPNKTINTSPHCTGGCIKMM